MLQGICGRLELSTLKVDHWSVRTPDFSSFSPYSRTDRTPLPFAKVQKIHLEIA